MSFADIIKKNQQTFNGKGVKYWFMPSDNPSDCLVVSFSAFSGKEAQGAPAVYNYVKPLSKINCHRLFILDDYDGIPCYYLGQNKGLDYESSVIGLIYTIANQYKIPSQNIITCGSSKGGTAALYFGLKYSLGHIVSGGFQIKVGSYLSTNEFTKEKVLGLIAGGSSEKHRDYLDNYYLDFINNVNINSNLYLHGGKGDSHYTRHVTIFTKLLDKKNIPYQLDVKNYSSHSEISPYFTDYILETIPKITNTLLIKETSIKSKRNKIEVSCSIPTHLAKSAQYAYYVYKDGHKEPIEKIMYTDNPKLTYKVNESGKYRIKIFVKNDKQKTSETTSSITI